MTNITDMNYAFNIALDFVKQKMQNDRTKAQGDLAVLTGSAKPDDMPLSQWRYKIYGLEANINYIDNALVAIEGMKK